jgi:hypothetical protein
MQTTSSQSFGSLHAVTDKIQAEFAVFKSIASLRNWMMMMMTMMMENNILLPYVRTIFKKFYRFSWALPSLNITPF